MKIDRIAPAPDQLERDLSALLGLDGMPARRPRLGAGAALLGASAALLLVASGAAFLLLDRPAPRPPTAKAAGRGHGVVEVPLPQAMIAIPERPAPARVGDEPAALASAGRAAPATRGAPARDAGLPASGPVRADERPRAPLPAADGRRHSDEGQAAPVLAATVARDTPKRAQPSAPPQRASGAPPPIASRAEDAVAAAGGTSARPPAPPLPESRQLALEPRQPQVGTARAAPADPPRTPAPAEAAAAPRPERKAFDSLDAIRTLRRQ